MSHYTTQPDQAPQSTAAPEAPVLLSYSLSGSLTFASTAATPEARDATPEDLALYLAPRLSVLPIRSEEPIWCAA